MSITRVGFLALMTVIALMSSCSGTSRLKVVGEEVNTGYGLQEKHTTTGAISSRRVGNNAYSSAMNLADMLRQMAGVRVQGQGNNTRVYLRGVTSSGIEQEPLFVVDGSVAGITYGAVSELSVADIERITVLRDISSTNIYGANGENGVIVIEMKKK